MILKADFDDETRLWTVHGRTGSRVFLEVCGAFGYGDPTDENEYAMNAVAVVGLQQDKCFNLLEEELGTLEHVGRTAVDMKDRLAFTRFFINPEPLDYRKRLTAIDGLTGYLSLGLNARGDPKYVRDSSHWEHFRSRGHVVGLVPVREQVLADYESHVTRLTQMTQEGTFLVPDWCPDAMRLGRETFATGRKHPLMKAMVFAMGGMLALLEPAGDQPALRGNSWYKNP
jgi:hypothetical protein